MLLKFIKNLLWCLCSIYGHRGPIFHEPDVSVAYNFVHGVVLGSFTNTSPKVLALTNINAVSSDHRSELQHVFPVIKLSQKLLLSLKKNRCPNLKTKLFK